MNQPAKNRLLIVFLLCLAACNQNSSDDNTPNTANPGGTQTQSGKGSRAFLAMQSQILVPKCGSCHGGSNPRGGFSISSYSAILNSGKVVPYKAAQSPLCLEIYRRQMPPNGPLSSTDINTVCRWIQSGAQ